MPSISKYNSKEGCMYLGRVNGWKKYSVCTCASNWLVPQIITGKAESQCCSSFAKMFWRRLISIFFSSLLERPYAALLPNALNISTALIFFMKCRGSTCIPLLSEIPALQSQAALADLRCHRHNALCSINHALSLSGAQ